MICLRVNLLRKYIFATLVTFSFALLPGCAQPANLTTLYRFPPPHQASLAVTTDFPASTEGNTPYSPLAAGGDGNFYGMTSNGGSSDGMGTGTVFKMTPAGDITVLHSFSHRDFGSFGSIQSIGNFKNADGANPEGALTLATGGSFYGTTKSGGADGAGTFFKIDASGSLTTLHSFSGVDGKSPTAGVVLGGDGSYYGTTSAGGASGLGTIFKISQSGTFTSLHSFTLAEGAHPKAALIQVSDGSFFGTASSGGIHGNGTVFKMSASGTVTTLHSFSAFAGKQISNLDGADPEAALLQAADGNLYGTTYGGGVNSVGTMFKLTLSGDFSTLASFTDANGAWPCAALIQAKDGSLYGTARGAGKNGYGTVFNATLSGVITSIHSFDAVNGCCPYASVIQGSDGSLYGTTSGGGVFGNGTIFKVTSAGVFTKLNGFNPNDTANSLAALRKSAENYMKQLEAPIGATNTVRNASLALRPKGVGPEPRTSLVEGTDGKFYGATCYGGTDGLGEVFCITASGEMTSLHSFAGDDGAFSRAKLIQATDGCFYSTTQNGGMYGGGTVFKITASGAFTSLYSFPSYLQGTGGSEPCAGLVQGKDGNFYGTTSAGGAYNRGTIYRITASGICTTLHSFTGIGGGSCQADMVQGSDGSFYGTTTNGGANGDGTIFKFTLPGSFEVLHHFTALDDGQWNRDGAEPYAPLVLASDGCLYGTTYTGGRYGNGTIFKVTTSGVFTTLHQIKDPEGSQSLAGLVEAKDGYLYGDAYDGGGDASMGTIFRMDKSGKLSIICAFDGTNGSYPESALIQATDGTLYGTTAGQSNTTDGTVFRLRLTH